LIGVFILIVVIIAVVLILTHDASCHLSFTCPS
jgi:hypothetical protein